MRTLEEKPQELILKVLINAPPPIYNRTALLTIFGNFDAILPEYLASP